MRNLRLREHRKLAQVTKTLGLGLNPPGVCSLFCGPFVWETEEGLGAPRATPTLPSSQTYRAELWLMLSTSGAERGPEGTNSDSNRSDFQ